MVQLPSETAWQFLKRLGTELPLTQQLRLGVYPGDVKHTSTGKTCTHMVIATLFIIAKGGNNMAELGRHRAKWKKAGTKGHVLYDCIAMKCSEQVNTQRETDQWLPETGR